MSLEWKVFIDDDNDPHLIIANPDRMATKEECERAARILNEDGNASSTVKLICQNAQCPDKGGWIERTRKDADKHVYACDTCGRPMGR